MPPCFPTPDYFFGFYLSPWEANPMFYTRHFLKSWSISYPLISKLPFCIVYNPYQDEAMKKKIPFQVVVTDPTGPLA